MEIKIGKYKVCSDNYCMWITVMVKPEKGGKEYEKKVAGYSINAEQLLDSFIEN